MFPKSFLVLAMSLIFGGIGFAQDLPDAPDLKTNSFPSAPSAGIETASGHESSGALVAARGPWINPVVADDAYWNSNAVLLGSTVLNVEMTARCSERGTCLTWIASGGAAGSTRLKLYAYTLPVDAAVAYLSYRLKAKHGWWMVPSALVSAANLFSAGRSYGRLQLAPVQKH